MAHPTSDCFPQVQHRQYAEKPFSGSAVMPGIDGTLLSRVSKDVTIGRINRNIVTDFVLAPHYSAIFRHGGDRLWDETCSRLRNGTYEPELPLVSEVPKRSVLTRPGAILNPFDRTVYQILADLMANTLETQLDRSRVQSYALADPDTGHYMFQPRSANFAAWGERVEDLCRTPGNSYALRTDVNSYFERIDQHRLKNLLDSSGIEPGVTNLLDKVLSAWSEKHSIGIPQGCFPSDLLGNYFLSQIDAHFALKDIQSVRYVDDIYAFFPNEREARRSIAPLVVCARGIGLTLNESKTEVIRASALLKRETTLSRMFDEARTEAKNQAIRSRRDWLYDFLGIWPDDDEVIDALDLEEIETEATEALWNERMNYVAASRDDIDLFCLPKLAAARSDVALETVIKEFGTRPHTSKAYAAYMSAFVKTHADAHKALELSIQDPPFIFDWELMWPLAALGVSESASSQTIEACLRLVKDQSRAQEIRALSAILIGKLGNGVQRGTLRSHYAGELSQYVRQAILFAARHFPGEERKACIRAWSGHHPVNGLIASVMKPD